MCTLALRCSPSLLSIVLFFTFSRLHYDVSPLCSRLLFTLFRACHYCFSLFSWLILTPLCSSRISVLALDILITELSEFSQTYILTVKHVSGWIIAHVRTQGFFPAQVERSRECQESGLMLLHMLQKNVQCWTLLHVMYSKLWHSYDVAQYLYNTSCKTSWEGLCATCIVAYCALHTVHNLWAMRIQVAC